MKSFSTLGFICSVPFSQPHSQETMNISFLCIFPESPYVYTSKYKYVFSFLSTSNANGSIMYTWCPTPCVDMFSAQKTQELIYKCRNSWKY